MKNDKDRYWDCLDQAMEASHSGRVEEALAWLDEALRVHPGGAEAHNGRGEIQWDEGHIDEARAHYESSLEIHREVGNRLGEAMVLANLGGLLRDTGALSDSRAAPSIATSWT